MRRRNGGGGSSRATGSNAGPDPPLAGVITDHLR